MKNGLTIVTVAAVAILAVSGAALAARGGNGGNGGGPGGGGKGGGSSIELVVLTSLSLGGQVTFNVSTNRTESPWVDVRCDQGGTKVYEQWQGFFPSYRWGQVFTLGPTDLWTSGGATCSARLVSWDNGRDRTLAELSFDAAG